MTKVTASAMRSLHAAILLFVLLTALPAAEPSNTAAASGCPACDMSMSVRSARVATTVGVSATEYQFNGMSTTINVGDTVTWTNNGTVVHTSTSDSLVWDSQDLAPGATYSFTFQNAGTFTYHCRYHGASPHFMTGTITVSAIAPVITSANAASGTVNTPFTYTITAANTPTSFGASGLPSGLSLAPSTGVISGVPTVAGTFSIGLSALNSGGIGTETLTLTVASPPPGSPVITSPTNVVGTVGVAFAYGITATGLPTVFGATNLPSGLGVDATTGQITGTPLVVSSTIATVSATNSFGTGAATVSFSIVDNGATTDPLSSATGGACGLGAAPAALALFALIALRGALWRGRRQPPA